MTTTRDIEYMRTSQKELLPQKVDIERFESEADTQGGLVRNWRLIYRQVPARIMTVQRARSDRRETTGAERVTEMADWTLSLHHDQDIQERDRVLYNGLTFEVISTNTATGYLTAKRAGLRLIQ